MSALEGHVDRYEHGRLKGWARRVGATEPVVVEAIVEGRVVARAPAYLLRGDLADNGIGDGRYGFEFVLDPPLGVPIAVRAAESGERIGELVVDRPSPLESFRPAHLRFREETGVEGILEEAGPATIRGWALPPKPVDPPVELELWEGEQRLMAFRAEAWRNDIEDRRGGDGACGFEFPAPDALCTGAVRLLDLRLAGGPSLLERPIACVFPMRPPQDEPRPASGRPTAKAKPDLSIVVVFYNMHREAARTLHSLSRAYQRGIDDLDYEVLCIDNGSKEPVEPAFVASFGPEFRLVQTSRILPSPCFAMNEAARAAKGSRIAVMIDGAHVLTPGAMAEAMSAMDQNPGAVVALRQWFVGGDQRWLSACGWSRDHEDKLFRKIDWPHDGYRLFQISSPMFESPNHWLDGMNESNCLFLDTDLFHAIGGMDEAFSEPGAGFANLDLFRRAVDNARGPTIALVGEATFHQYHGGTTTNVTDAAKDALVAEFEKNYASVRGVEFESISTDRLHVWGKIHTDQALTARQHLMFPGTLSATERIRPIQIGDFLDEDAQAYARTVYIESGQLDLVRWLGEPVRVAPADLTNIQTLMGELSPRTIIIADDGKGLCRFVADSTKLMGLDCEILHVRPRHEGSADADVVQIEGVVDAAETLDAIQARLGPGPVMVLFEPRPGDHLPKEALFAYAEFVTEGSYLVFLRTAISQPYLGYLKDRRIAAAQALWRTGSFEADTRFQYQIISMCPFGYLRRIS